MGQAPAWRQLQPLAPYPCLVPSTPLHTPQVAQPLCHTLMLLGAVPMRPTSTVTSQVGWVKGTGQRRTLGVALQVMQGTPGMAGRQQQLGSSSSSSTGTQIARSAP